jgi:hypothetical protein
VTERRHDSVPVEKALLATVGPSGRMISYSKSRYREAHPEHVAVFNANICLGPGRKVWHGDLDVTKDEPLLHDLARRTGTIVYVLYEFDGRFKNADTPLIAEAVFSVTPSGHTRFGEVYVERAADGTLRRRKLPTVRHRRFVFSFARPRLLRFWLLDTEQVVTRQTSSESRFLYVGRTPRPQDGRELPFLVLGIHRWRWNRRTMLEWTWYPTPKHHVPRPLFNVGLAVSHGPVRPWVRVYVHPGLMYELVLGMEHGPKTRWW